MQHAACSIHHSPSFPPPLPLQAANADVLKSQEALGLASLGNAPVPSSGYNRAFSENREMLELHARNNELALKLQEANADLLRSQQAILVPPAGVESDAAMSGPERERVQELNQEIAALQHRLIEAEHRDHRALARETANKEHEESELVGELRARLAMQNQQ